MSKTTKTLEQLRSDAANTLVRAYGAGRAYADRLNETLPLAWFDIDKSAPVADKIVVETERAAFIAVLEKAKAKNPREGWRQIRAYAREAMAPAKAESEAEGEAEGEAEAEATDKRVDQTAKWLKTLATVAAQIEKADGVTFPALKVHDGLKSVIAIMSGGIKG